MVYSVTMKAVGEVLLQVFGVGEPKAKNSHLNDATKEIKEWGCSLVSLRHPWQWKKFRESRKHSLEAREVRKFLEAECK